jgi:hypothetical protein
MDDLLVHDGGRHQQWVPTGDLHEVAHAGHARALDADLAVVRRGQQSGVGRLYARMTGPAGTQLGTAATSFPAQLPAVSFDTGVIAGTRSWNPLLKRGTAGSRSASSLPALGGPSMTARWTRADGRAPDATAARRRMPPNECVTKSSRSVGCHSWICPAMRAASEGLSSAFSAWDDVR